ncbi:MAG: phospholipase [Acidobacteria bacterium]|nr:MAG: phospholipase [Acidobacteriota bacterium]
MPDAEQHAIAALIHGRYHVDPRAGEGAPLLVGCHGYGENAARHLAELRRIPGAEDWLLCAVEGLHRFYNSRTQEVVGSWMTREGREQAVVDNLRYVIGVLAEVRRRYRPAPTLVFAGFSQGVAMAYRAAAACGWPCAGLLALAGDVPPDVASRPGVALPPVLLGRGTEDAWYDDGKMTRDLEVLARLGVAVETCVFDGGHVWSDEYRAAAGRFLRRLAGRAPISSS